MKIGRKGNMSCFDSSTLNLLIGKEHLIYGCLIDLCLIVYLHDLLLSFPYMPYSLNNLINIIYTKTKHSVVNPCRQTIHPNPLHIIMVRNVCNSSCAAVRAACRTLRTAVNKQTLIEQILISNLRTRTRKRRKSSLVSVEILANGGFLKRYWYWNGKEKNDDATTNNNVVKTQLSVTIEHN